MGGGHAIALFDRGNGLIYDDVLNITLSKDANLFKTQAASDHNLVDTIINNVGNYDSHVLTISDFNEDGSMTYWGAQAWITSLNSQHYLGYSDWRLPVTNPVNGNSYNYATSYDGTTDQGMYITNPSSELAYLSNVELHNISAYLPDGTDNPAWRDPISGAVAYNVSGTFSDAANNNIIDSFINLQAPVWYGYWAGQPTGTLFNQSTNLWVNLNEFSWYYNFAQGRQNILYKDYSSSVYAWAVRSGDVAPVPVPAAIYLFGSGLLGLLSLKRRKAA